MMRYRRAFAEYARVTEPGESALARLRARQQLPAALLAEIAQEPGPGAVRRVIINVTPHGTQTRRWPVLLPLAAAALLWLVWPPRRLDERLDAPAPLDRALTEEIHLQYSGSGSVTGTAKAAHIFWEVGTLRVELEPDRGVDLEVETSEGRVAVVGTAFSVTRGPLGTEVTVQRGHVIVSCNTGYKIDIVDTGGAWCLPVRAAGMLGRARALRAAGEPSEDVLAAVAEGLSLAKPGEPATGELVALRLDVLISEGRYPEALSAAEAYLRSGEAARREEVTEIVQALRARL